MAKIGVKYKHFKGGEYRVILIARDCEDSEKEIVVYQSLYDSKDFPIGTFWIRSLEDFDGFKDIGGERIKRFEEVRQGSKSIVVG